MPQFRFRLAMLLRLRENFRDQERQSLAAARQAEDSLRAQIESLNRELAQSHRRTQAAAQPGTISAGRLLEIVQYQAALTARRETLSEQLTAARQQVEKCREQLVEADRQVKTLEKLRGRQVAAHQTAESRRETKQLDEAVIRRLYGSI